MLSYRGARDPDTVVTEMYEMALAAANHRICLPFDEDAVKGNVKPNERHPQLLQRNEMI